MKLPLHKAKVRYLVSNLDTYYATRNSIIDSSQDIECVQTAVTRNCLLNTVFLDIISQVKQGNFSLDKCTVIGFWISERNLEKNRAQRPIFLRK